ncbi:adenylate/guanylate cyclase domain-containing protein [Myxococcota bacterium]|nr:adenylate/guanylate cyclase domain-containing protein [Myxococcota bacterium]
MRERHPTAGPDDAVPATLARLIEASDRPMLVATIFAVAAYLAQLAGLWPMLGLDTAYRRFSLVVDLVFLADLLLKLLVLRGPYLRSPWFLVDLVAALPVLGSLPRMPDAIAALRVVRTLRFFRLLRTVRMVRVLGMFRAAEEAAGDSPEGRDFRRALYLAVVSYTGMFMGVLAAVGEDRRAELFLVLGSVLGMILILVVTRYRVRDLSAQQVRALLNVALPVQVARHLFAHPEAAGHTEHAPATVIFCDLVGFTEAVEGLDGDLDRLKQHLEAAFDVVVDAHVEQDLIVDKFIGDAVMSFRGGSLVPGSAQDHAARVVRAAVAGSRALAALGDPYFRALKVGGASAERAVIGAFGTSRRLSYTVLGDDVNLASRLEAACGQVGACTLFCPRTRALAGEVPGVAWRRIGRVRVKGKADDIEVFEALPAEEAGPWLALYEEGVRRIEAQDFALALDRLSAADQRRQGGDPASRVQARRAARLVDEPPGPGWDPAMSVTK